MESLMHSCHKIMLERAAASGNNNNQITSPQTPDVAPPAYSAEAIEDTTESDMEDEDLLEDPSPVILNLNAGTDVEGTGNMIATPPLADATRLSALLLAAVQSLNNAKTQATENGSQTAVLQVNLVINCGVTVHGDRNVIGYKTQGVLPANKRKATEESEEAPEAKNPKAE